VSLSEGSGDSPGGQSSPRELAGSTGEHNICFNGVRHRAFCQMGARWVSQGLQRTYNIHNAPGAQLGLLESRGVCELEPIDPLPHHAGGHR